MTIEKIIEKEAEELYPKNPMINSPAYVDTFYNEKRAAYIAGRSAQIESEKKDKERIKALEEMLTECDEYFDNYADADYINEQFSPNPEMNLLSRIRNLLTKNN